MDQSSFAQVLMNDRITENIEIELLLPKLIPRPRKARLGRPQRVLDVLHTLRKSEYEMTEIIAHTPGTEVFIEGRPLRQGTRWGQHGGEGENV